MLQTDVQPENIMPAVPTAGRTEAQRVEKKKKTKKKRQRKRKKRKRKEAIEIK